MNSILTTKTPRAPSFTKIFVKSFLDRCSVRRRRTRSKFSEKAKPISDLKRQDKTRLILFFQKIIERLKMNNDPENFVCFVSLWLKS